MHWRQTMCTIGKYFNAKMFRFFNYVEFEINWKLYFLYNGPHFKLWIIALTTCRRTSCCTNWFSVVCYIFWIQLNFILVYDWMLVPCSSLYLLDHTSSIPVPCVTHTYLSISGSVYITCDRMLLFRATWYIGCTVARLGADIALLLLSGHTFAKISFFRKTCLCVRSRFFWT